YVRCRAVPFRARAARRWWILNMSRPTLFYFFFFFGEEGRGFKGLRGVGVWAFPLPIPGAVARRAVALAEWLPAVRRIDLLDRLVPALAGLTGAAGAAALSERECAAFAARDWLLGRTVRAPAAGRARGLRTDGR